MLALSSVTNGGETNETVSKPVGVRTYPALGDITPVNTTSS